MRIGSLCTGYGGLDMAVQAVLGGEVAWVADPDPGPAAILAHHHPGVPNLGDITAVDWADVEPVDVLTAGFPCQDISYAGRGAGIKKGTRSGLWSHVVETARLLRPRLLLLENVAGIAVRRPGLDVVLADLARFGFDAEWVCVRASDVGAPHPRARWFLLAWPATDTADVRHERGGPPRGRRPGPADGGGAAADPNSDRRAGIERRESGVGARDDADGRRPVNWGPYAAAVARWEHVLGRPAPAPTRPDGRGGAHRLNPECVEWLMGLPAGHVTDPAIGLSRTQQLRALGNGVVPQQGAAALRLLLERAGLGHAQAA